MLMNSPIPPYLILQLFDMASTVFEEEFQYHFHCCLQPEVKLSGKMCAKTVLEKNKDKVNDIDNQRKHLG